MAPRLLKASIGKIHDPHRQAGGALVSGKTTNNSRELTELLFQIIWPVAGYSRLRPRVYYSSRQCKSTLTVSAGSSSGGDCRVYDHRSDIAGWSWSLHDPVKTYSHHSAWDALWWWMTHCNLPRWQEIGYQDRLPLKRSWNSWLSMVDVGESWAWVTL